MGRGLELTPYKIALAEHFISFIHLFNMTINYFQESLIVNNSFLWKSELLFSLYFVRLDKSIYMDSLKTFMVFHIYKYIYFDIL